MNIIGVFQVALVACFLAIKVCGLAAISWWLVFSPILLEVALLIAWNIIKFIIHLVAMAIDGYKAKKTFERMMKNV